MSFIGKCVTDFIKTQISSISPFKIEEISPQNYLNVYEKNYPVIENFDGKFYLYKIANYYESLYILTKKDKDINSKIYSVFRYQGPVYDAKKLHARYYSVLTMLDDSFFKIDRVLLEKICDCIRIHKSWTAAHVAAHLEMQEAFRNSKLTEIINVKDKETGITPLHIAVGSGNVELVKEILLLASIDLNILDTESNSVIHLAAAHETQHILTLLVNKSAISVNVLNNSGRTALHIACEAKSVVCIETLIRFSADPNISDSDEYPIHVAMRVSSMECIKTLCQYFPEHINAKNKKTGATALHMVTNRTELASLMGFGADVNAQDGLGMTILHTVVKQNNFEMVYLLLLYSADTNIKTNHNETALHLAMKECDVDIIRGLIVFEVDLNALNNDKDSARHILCSSKSLRYQHSRTKDIVLYTINAVGAKRCDTKKAFCTDGCEDTGKFNGNAPTLTMNTVDHAKDVLEETIRDNNGKTSKDSDIKSNKSEVNIQADFENQESDWYYLNSKEAEGKQSKKSGIRLLSLDGGGIRGLVLVQTLRALERVSGRRMADLFDWIGGTSTGGLLAISIVYKLSLRDCRIMYLNIKDKVFVGKRPYSSEYLENVVKEQVGIDTTMTCVKEPKLAVTALHCDRFPPKLHLFRNYDPPLNSLKQSISMKETKKDLKSSGVNKIPSMGTHDPTAFSQDIKPPSEQLVWEVAKATGAAPTFFRSCGAYLDGGLIANNPTLDLLTEIYEYNLVKQHNNEPQEPLGIVVSVGTGRPPIVPVSNIDVFRPNNPLDLYNIVQGMSVLTKVMVEMATAAEGRVVDRARAWCYSIDVPFFRMSPPLGAEISLDETDDKIILEMLWDTESYLYRSQDRLKKLSEFL